MSWRRALKDTARSGLAVEKKRLEPLGAVRGAAGLAIVIAVSLWAFGPAVAASSAFGAFQAAIATFQRSWRPRPELALASGASLAVSTFLGYLTVSWEPLFLALLVVWTFAAGLSWAAGPTIGLIASSNVAMMLVTVTLPTSVAEAAGHAAMMIVGGVVQAALVVLFPVRRWGAHRDALADALAAEADYARRLRHDPLASFDPLPLMEARNAAAVTPRQARRRPAELHGARGIAERIRPVLASLADPAAGVPAEGRACDRVRELLAATGTVLDAAAHAIRRGEPVAVPAAALAVLRTPDTGSILTGRPYRAATRLGTLLQDVLETAGGSTPASRTEAGRGPGHGVGRAEPPPQAAAARSRPTFLALVPTALTAMRKELREGSPITRHATRVAAVAAVGYVLGTALPLGHGYWAPLTSVMVMRPDFSQTYSRAVARLGGTVVGVGVATAVVRLADPGTYLSGVLAVVSAGLMYLLMRTGQFAAQACIAAYVVLLLGMGGEQWTQTVPERVLLTLLGGLLAMIAYAVYPAWETPRLRTRLADWLATQGRYAAVVLGSYADPASRNVADVREALLTARTARAAWHTAVARATAEPVRHRGLSRTAADDAEDALAQLGRVVMLLEAHLPERDATPVPAAAALAEALRESTQQGARAVRERRVPNWDAVRAALEAWETATAVRAPGAAGAPEDPGAPGAPDTASASKTPGADPGKPDGVGAVASGNDAFVRDAARLVLDALTELSEALDTAVPPMTLDGTAGRGSANDGAGGGGDSGGGDGDSGGSGGGSAGGVRNPDSP
ncbi:putative membrane protein YccC [Streptomyces sp. V3I8]|uniref:FUSC family protein n=1 Tax=Streptomyces sp. V3I8 TaxID=3042279 RepID=UPI002784321B|nr:FUSC family protein [Streptomyces sp. V3I8]MDQ1037859.1 putative membrane protein YccC [Streptomyces sp. V3I8]